MVDEGEGGVGGLGDDEEGGVEVRGGEGDCKGSVDKGESCVNCL